MDFLRGNGVIVDYSDGLRVCAKLAEAKPVKLPMNHKQHYLIDVDDFLCNGETNRLLRSLEIQLHEYEMFPLTFDLDMQPLYRLHEDKSSRSNDFFTSLWKRHRNFIYMSSKTGSWAIRIQPLSILCQDGPSRSSQSGT